MKATVSACVPCFNNAKTVRRAIESLLHQTIAPDDVFVVDDGSTDGSPDVLQDLVRVVRHGVNLGRGAARATAMSQAIGHLVLSVDATAVLPRDFLERALPWFDDPMVAAVYARVDDPAPEGVVRRWRARHLFRTGSQADVAHRASLITGGSIMRRSAVLKVGNFNAKMRQVEDADLGERLLAAGFDVVSDPHLRVISVARSTVLEVMERYWRWGAGVDESVSLTWYRKQIAYSVKVMVRQDLAAGDVLAVPLSLFSPHYQFWRTFGRRIKRRIGAAVAP